MTHESNDIARMQLMDSMFSVEYMYKRVEDMAGELQLTETAAALPLMRRAHQGQVRKGKGRIPYIVHPLTMACHAFATGITSDSLIAALLLHDVVEDTEVTLEDLQVSDRTKAAVALVTKDGLKSQKDYYADIATDSIATMVKLFDRCNNISTMTTGFDNAKIISYMAETEKYVFPLIDTVKEKYQTYYNQAFLLKYQMLAVMQSISTTLQKN